MNRQSVSYFGGLVAIMLVTAVAVQAKNLKDVEITDEFPLERCIGSLVTSCAIEDGDCNQYLPLVEGRVWELDNLDCDDCEEEEEVTVSMLGVQEIEIEVDGVPTFIMTRIMEEREVVDGELAEVSQNFLVQCSNTQDVYYFGEEVCVDEDSDEAQEEPPFPYGTDCEEGLTFGGGAWKAGVDQAEPGILFPGGAFLLGARYLQERAENALDWATNAELGLSADDPVNGEFEDCVLVIDRNLLEDPKSKEDGDEKVYCPDIGIVQDEELELTSCTTSAVNCEQ